MRPVRWMLPTCGRVVEGYEPCFETKVQWLPSQLESPM